MRFTRHKVAASIKAALAHTEAISAAIAQQVARVTPDSPQRPTRKASARMDLQHMLRDAGVHNVQVFDNGEVKTLFSTKGDPGDDSVNACIPTDPAKCKYAAFSNFLLAIDILVSSGVQVDTIHDDFSDYYEMFALGEFDKWYSAQIVSSGGSDQGLRCEFGISHLENYCNG